MISPKTSDEAKRLQLLHASNKIFPLKSDGTGKKAFGMMYVNVDGYNLREQNRKSWHNLVEANHVSSKIVFTLKVFSY